LLEALSALSPTAPARHKQVLMDLCLSLLAPARPAAADARLAELPDGLAEFFRPAAALPASTDIVHRALQALLASFPTKPPRHDAILALHHEW
jgi:hypothetical protein